MNTKGIVATLENSPVSLKFILSPLIGVGAMFFARVVFTIISIPAVILYVEFADSLWRDLLMEGLGTYALCKGSAIPIKEPSKQKVAIAAGATYVGVWAILISYLYGMTGDGLNLTVEILGVIAASVGTVIAYSSLE